MLAMQYSFVLPADYEMAIIRRRIADKGHLLDNFPGLIFKAYLSADRNQPRLGTQDNLYAPFYVWQDAQAMNQFLCGAGFVALTQAFGWPVIKTWSVWSVEQAEQTEGSGTARYATRELMTIPPHTSLAELRLQEVAWAEQAVSDPGVLNAVAGFEPTTWTLVRFRLWRDLPPGPSSPLAQHYEVGHISRPQP